ncbi:protein lifeguard 3 isoform 1-T1 [Clarias gariepinus]|uniref:protein lifeguard 3 isoform X1 n=1 Tax=Clarias gariepinus TaxID=13013 RepID=UPI00234D7A99|nr:protein lifeguard 3 isoform X1 [Clarias gariepinus]
MSQVPSLVWNSSELSSWETSSSSSSSCISLIPRRDMKSPRVILILSRRGNTLFLHITVSHPTPSPLQSGTDQENQHRGRCLLFPHTRPRDQRLPPTWVYLILAAQLSFTTSIVAVFTFVDPVHDFVVEYPVILWLSFGVFFPVYLVLVCSENARRRFPVNLVLLFIFTLAMSYMTGALASYYETKSVFLALGITAVVCVSVTVFSFQTKVDFTSCTGLFCVLAIVLLITGIIATIVLSFQYIPWLHMLYAALGAIIYTLFLAYDTQLLLGNRTLSLSPEEYVFGALTLYTDIIQLFLFMLQLIGSRNE